MGSRARGHAPLHQAPRLHPPSLAVILLLLTLWTTTINEGEGVEVFRFQPDGVARLDTQAVYKGSLDVSKRMSQFTFCGRVKIFFLHGRGTYFQLRDDVENIESMLKGELFLDRVRPVIHKRWQFQLLREKLRTLKWYHLCFTYDQEHTLYTTYLDGVKVYELVYDVGRPVHGNYARLGQSGEILESFSGEVSQINVWDYLLPAKEIKAMAACEMDKHGNYISWDVGWTPENVETYNVTLAQFCMKSTEPIMFGFPKLFDFQAYYICRALGTTLPLTVTKKDISRYHKLIDDNWRNETHCHDRYWTPLTDEKQEGHWVRSYDNRHVAVVPWNDGEPNGLWYENCGFIVSDGVDDDDCKSNIRCATCEFTDVPVFRMVGICERELRNMHFVVYQERLGQLLFRGYSDYVIEFLNDRWVWYDRTSNQTMAKMQIPKITVPHYPMGRRDWELISPVCGQQDGVRTLLLTHCEEAEFTCDDGTCISLSFRCDQKYDCLDHSDENFCDNVVTPESYKKDLTPRSQDDDQKGLPIMLDAIIKSIDIDTMKTTMSLAFELKQTWFDNRLQYVNLKPNDSLNRVSFILMGKLWSPEVAFVNTPDNQHTQVDVESSMIIHRLSEPTSRDPSAPAEVDLYPGIDNTLTISRLYSVTFVCDFNLALYPFDNQLCHMRMRMLSASANYLYFDADNSTITYLGTSFLVEYEIESLTVHPGDPGEFSEILFRLKLIRRYGFAVLTIYMPSLVLLVISYVTLFFMPRIFEVRVMSALTALLVVATIFTQASGSLPRTSYFKFVDIWLLFCIGIIFLIIIFHTVIDVQLHKQYSSTRIKVGPMFKGEEEMDFDPNERILRRLIVASRVTVLAIFTLFNLIHWGQIFF